MFRMCIDTPKGPSYCPLNIMFQFQISYNRLEWLENNIWYYRLSIIPSTFEPCKPLAASPRVLWVETNVVFFVYLPCIKCIQSIPGLNGLSKGPAFDQRWKMHFVGSFSSFPEEIDNKEQLQIFFWLIVNSLSPAIHWQRCQDCRRQSRLRCTHVC